MAIQAAEQPLRRLFESYTGCLTLDRSFMAETQAEEELNLDRLESFLRARADLLAAAESGFQALEAVDSPADRALLRQVVAVLEEMTNLEGDLSAFLDEHLRHIGEVVRHLRKVQPVFKRYGHLGGDKAAPSRVTRRE